MIGPDGKVINVYLLFAVNALNDAIRALMNIPESDYRGPYLGDINGYRGKILRETTTAANAVVSGLKAVHDNVSPSSVHAPSIPAK